MPAVLWQRFRFSTTSGRPCFDGALDPGLEIEPLFEVHEDQVVAADRAVQRERAAVDVDAVDARHRPRLRDQVLDDLLEILQLAR